MSIYMSSFTTGFQDVIKTSLSKHLNGIKIKYMFDGLVVFEYNGNWKNILNISYLNNSFLVGKIFNGKQLNFSSMINQIIKLKNFCPINMNSFRVRFSKENQFVGVDKKQSQLAEQFLSKISHMRIDRLNPKTEFWFIIRRENIGFFAQLLEKRKTTEKKLNQGELRPEFAHLMCEFAQISNNNIICDPFAGFASIPLQIVSKFKFKKLYISDINTNCINYIKTKNVLKNNSKVFIKKGDALKLDWLEDNSIDLIITDPPWGYYEQIENIEEFYKLMLKSFDRVLSNKGKIVVLSARKNELLSAIEQENFVVNKRIDTLVNGKKAGIFILNRRV